MCVTYKTWIGDLEVQLEILLPAGIFIQNSVGPLCSGPRTQSRHTAGPSPVTCSLTFLTTWPTYLFCPLEYTSKLLEGRGSQPGSLDVPAPAQPVQGPRGWVPWPTAHSGPSTACVRRLKAHWLEIQSYRQIQAGLIIEEYSNLVLIESTLHKRGEKDFRKHGPLKNQPSKICLYLK